MSPFVGKEPLTIVSKEDVAGTISCLLGLRRPPTVVWTVWTVIVDAIQTKARKSKLVVVGNECSEIEPSIAHSNAPAAVAMVCDMIWISAALLH